MPLLAALRLICMVSLIALVHTAAERRIKACSAADFRSLSGCV
jgi:hypothetical protein